MKTESEIVSDHWAIDRQGDRPANWLDHPTARRFIQRRITGHPTLDTASWFKQTFLPQPLNLALSLCCGFGAYERYCIGLGIAKAFHAMDLSSGAIEKAKAAALAAGMADKIEYRVQDLNEANFPLNTYDAIFAISSAHHIFQLERFFRGCQLALRPGALLFIDDYIGPSRFQCSQEIVAIINKCLELLPSRYRKNLVLNDGSTIDRFTPYTIEHFETFDPSEAVRSGEIINTLRMYFEIIEMRPYGGAILQMLLSGIAGNFDETDERDVLILDLLATFEETLEKSGMIGSDLAVIVARPK